MKKSAWWLWMIILVVCLFTVSKNVYADKESEEKAIEESYKKHGDKLRRDSEITNAAIVRRANNEKNAQKIIKIIDERTELLRKMIDDTNTDSQSYHALSLKDFVIEIEIAEANLFRHSVVKRELLKEFPIPALSESKEWIEICTLMDKKVELSKTVFDKSLEQAIKEIREIHSRVAVLFTKLITRVNSEAAKKK